MDFSDIEKIEKAMKLGLRYVEVSVDSVNPVKHNKLKGIRGS